VTVGRGGGAAPRRILSIVGIGLVGAGCAVGPNYKRPTVPLSSTYEELTPAGATEWRPAHPNDAAGRGPWWEMFGDSDLNALEEQVNVSNQTLAQAEAQFGGARAVARGARADFFPSIGVSPSVRRARVATGSTGLPPTTTTVYSLSGDASYEVDVWGRIRRNVEASVESAKASAADLETVRLSLHAELAVDFFLLHGLDAQRQLLATNVDAYEKALQLTMRRHDQGVVSGVDVAQAETQLETTRAQLTDLSIARAQLGHAIAILVGKPPADLTIPPAPIVVPPPAVPVGLPSELLERRPDIAAAERRVAAANAQIGVAQAAFFPQLLLSASGGWEGSSLTKWFSAPSLFWSLGAALAQTIFDGGKRIALKEQARALYDADVASYREQTLTALQDVEDNLVALRLLEQEAAEQARAVEAAARAVALAQNRYEGGITTYLEVVTAQAIALANERSAVDLQTRSMTASVALIKALGGGWSSAALPSTREILWGPEPKPTPDRVPTADSKATPPKN
jgi:NodT family efflux transporter outer membrane factor (OMF) lipoprotein